MIVGTCATGSPSQENRLPTGRSSPTPTPRRARERSSPLIGSQPMGVGESCYSVPSLVRFPLVRACRTTLREAFGLLKRCFCSRREVQELRLRPARGWARRRSGRGASSRVPRSGPRGESVAEGSCLAPGERRPLTLWPLGCGRCGRTVGMGPYGPPLPH